jgi:hypothetical protein
MIFESCFSFLQQPLYEGQKQNKVLVLVSLGIQGLQPLCQSELDYANFSFTIEINLTKSAPLAQKVANHSP